MDYVEQKYWDEHYQVVEFKEMPDDDEIKKWLLKYIPKGKGDCIEIGVYPGGFINEFAKLGYRIHGIDLTPKVSKLKNLFISKGYKVGDFEQYDFLQFKPERKYDIVCSFGFIEHFDNYQNIISRHGELLRPGGILIITVPNFRGGLQKFLHRYLDNELLKLHNLNSMNLDAWNELLVDEKYEIITKNYIGKFNFWCGAQNRNFLQRMSLKILGRLIPVLHKTLFWPSLFHSPYMGLIAKKNDDE